MVLHRLKRIFEDRSALRSNDPGISRQYGAIPYTVVRGQCVMLLVTSRRTGRWIFPKGAPMDGLTPWETAEQEALEEAGVEGEIETVPIGAYRTMKTFAIRRAAIEVELYPLLVIRQLDDWPERANRHRHWVLLPEARRLLSEPRLAELATLLNRRVVVGDQPVSSRMDA